MTYNSFVNYSSSFEIQQHVIGEEIWQYSYLRLLICHFAVLDNKFKLVCIKPEVTSLFDRTITRKLYTIFSADYNNGGRRFRLLVDV